MTAQELIAAATQKTPLGGATQTQECLWLAGSGDWHAAHDLCEHLPHPDGSWIHAHLHRQEGDLSNAQYWYHRANKPMPETSLSIQQEWQQLVHALC